MKRQSALLHNRTPREKALIGLMVMVALAVVGWWGVLQPLDRWAEAAAQRREMAAARLAEVTQIARSGAASGASPAANIESLAADAAGEAGLTLSNLRHDGDELVATIEAASPGAVFAWAQALAGEGIAVTNLTAAGAGDGAARFEIALQQGPAPQPAPIAAGP